MEKIELKSFEQMDSDEIKHYYQNFVEQIKNNNWCDNEAANYQAITIISWILKSKNNLKLEKFWFEILKPAYVKAQNYKAKLDIQFQTQNTFREN